MIISLSGKKRSGKDTAGKIAQILLSFPKISNEDILRYLNGGSYDNPKWQIKKWAGKLKEMVSLLTGFTIAQLEDEEVKNIVLNKVYIVTNKFTDFEEEYSDHSIALAVYANAKTKWLKRRTADAVAEKITIVERDITPRLILQKLGTEIGRQITNDIWINALLSDYKSNLLNNGNFVTHIRPDGSKMSWVPNPIMEGSSYPLWIITDTRFPNEANTVKRLKGINIRIQRDNEGADLHESEVALDDYEGFNYRIDNNGTLYDLINRVREILTIEKLI